MISIHSIEKALQVMCSFHSVPSYLLSVVMPCWDKHYPRTLFVVAAFHSKNVTIGANDCWHHTLFTQINGKTTQKATFKIRVTTLEFIDCITKLSHIFCRSCGRCCYMTHIWKTNYFNIDSTAMVFGCCRRTTYMKQTLKSKIVILLKLNFNLGLIEKPPLKFAFSKIERHVARRGEKYVRIFSRKTFREETIWKCEGISGRMILKRILKK
jgi:hypothetical protein